MYLINTEISANWNLYADISPPLLEDLSVQVVGPGCATPTSFEVLSDNYTRPTIDTMGFIVHKFTPTEIGLWEITLLVSGTIVHTHEIFVLQNDTTITRFVSAACLP